MISSVNNSNSNLMQLLLAAMKNSSSTTAADSTGSSVTSSTDGSSSVNSSDQAGEKGFLSCLQDNFSKIDSNTDGQLSKDEIGTYMKNNRPMGPPPGMVIENMQSNDSQSIDAKPIDDVASTDSNKSAGKAHHGHRLQKAFDELDTNQDGTVSKEELAAAITNNVNGSTDQTSGKNSDNSISEVFDSIFSKLSSSSDSTKMIEQFAKKLTDAYGKQGGNLLSSALDLAI